MNNILSVTCPAHGKAFDQCFQSPFYCNPFPMGVGYVYCLKHVAFILIDL